jgi:hypothetical protein
VFALAAPGEPRIREAAGNFGGADAWRAGPSVLGYATVGQFTDDELRDVVSGYESSKNEALQRRDEQLREFHARGWRPVDLQRVTGYSRETIRQALHPKVREAANTNRRKLAPTPSRPPATAYTSYSDRKPYVVADRLDDLRGPTSGTVTLPRHLDWSGDASYDLGKPARLASMYRTVLNEAGSVDDLKRWIDGRALARLWSALWLPAHVRRLWEARFPELTAAPALAR